MHRQQQDGSSLAASHEKEGEKVPDLLSARELLGRELETCPFFRALKKVRALFEPFMAPLKLQGAEVMFPSKTEGYGDGQPVWYLRQAARGWTGSSCQAPPVEVNSTKRVG